jgi:transcriptional regulator with GAF, ATPase, and Fis domain
VFPIDVPPLRDRREDIPLLVHYFTNKYARMGKQIESIPKEAMDALSRYSWPRNIRELQNSNARGYLASRDLSVAGRVVIAIDRVSSFALAGVTPLQHGLCATFRRENELV